MKALQYKAIREAGVDEFAVFPADVESKLPWVIEHANKAESVRACPTGLVCATILKDDVNWYESFTLGCGDREYQRKRRNGVLIEMPLEKLRAATKAKVPTIQKLPRVKIVRRGGTRVVEMIVSKSAIMAPWGEYALIEAEREKAAEDEAERKARLDAAVGALGARSGRFTEVSEQWDGEKGERLPPEDYDYLASFDWRGGDRLVYLQGEVVLSLDRAEEIAALLNKTGVTP